MSIPSQVRELVLILLVFIGVEMGVRTPLAAGQPDPTGAADGTAAKQAILDSPAWMEAVRGFEEWLSVQVTYPKEQVPHLKATFQAQVDKMSASQLRIFLTDLEPKLAVLLSQEALEERAWTNMRLNLLSAAKAAEFRKSMPDVAEMTALQIRQALEELKQRRAADAANQEAFENFRNEQEAAARTQQLAEALAKAATTVPMNRTAADFHPGLNGSNYAPRTFRRYPGIGAGYGGRYGRYGGFGRNGGYGGYGGYGGRGW